MYPYQPSNLVMPPKAYLSPQNQPKSTNSPPYYQNPFFNKNPLQPIPLKEASILIAGGSGLIGMYKGYNNLTKGKLPLKPLKALAISPIGTLWGIMEWGIPALWLVQAWNYILERKRKQALGIPTSLIADAKESSRLAWQGIKSMVSPNSSSQ